MKLRQAAAGVVAVIVLGACGGESRAPAASPADADELDVTAAFYPLEFVVAELGGAHVSVTNLTPAGGEPHDLELSARDAAALHDADLVVYLDGFAPALDDAIAGLATRHVIDVTAAARLGEDRADDDHSEELAGEDRAEEEAHDHDQAGTDPHFWLDPIRYADVADAVAARLGELAPGHADDFTANAATLRAELARLDVEFVEGLADCASRDLVTSHTAFNYLAERYGLRQVGITGLSPSTEPAPGKLAEVTDFVEEHGVTTVFYETLVDPAVAETLAAETGADTAVLDPLEGLTDASAGGDYFEVMRANLARLRAGLRCS